MCLEAHIGMREATSEMEKQNLFRSVQGKWVKNKFVSLKNGNIYCSVLQRQQYFVRVDSYDLANWYLCVYY